MLAQDRKYGWDLLANPERLRARMEVALARVSRNVDTNPLTHLLSGGMLMCAFFIATDPVTAPLTRRGMWIFGAGVGLLIIGTMFTDSSGRKHDRPQKSAP